MTSVNLAETVDVCCRRFGLGEDDLRDVLAPLLATGRIAVVPATEAMAWKAAQLRIRHYARREREISLADCFLLAAAGGEDEIATADPGLAGVARSIGVGLIALPDSAGQRP